MMIKGHALDLIEQLTEAPDLIVTDPPYAAGGQGDEHALTAVVACTLRESARRLKKGRWMLVMCAPARSGAVDGGSVRHHWRAAARPVRRQRQDPARRRGLRHARHRLRPEPAEGRTQWR